MNHFRRLHIAYIWSRIVRTPWLIIRIHFRLCNVFSFVVNCPFSSSIDFVNVFLLFFFFFFFVVDLLEKPDFLLSTRIVLDRLTAPSPSFSAVPFPPFQLAFSKALLSPKYQQAFSKVLQVQNRHRLFKRFYLTRPRSPQGWAKVSLPICNFWKNSKLEKRTWEKSRPINS